MTNYFKKSLVRQYMILLGGFIIALIIGWTTLLFYQHWVTNIITKEISILEEKEYQAEELERSFNRVFSEIRGFMAFDSQSFLIKAKEEQNSIDQLLINFREKIENTNDEQFYQEVTIFYDYYFNQTLPQSIEYRQAGNLDKVKEISQNGATSKVNQMMKTLKAYRLDLNKQVGINYALLTNKINQSQIAFIIFFFFIVGGFLQLSRLMFKRIGQPLKQLAIASEQVSAGIENVSFQVAADRVDELGILSRAFEKMLKSIQENEQALLSQNEELIAQQDELQAQQDELQYALRMKEEKETVLNLRNKFVNLLTNTLNKQDLLNGIINTFTDLFHTEKGIIVLLNENLDHASIGVSKTGIQTFLESLEDGILLHVQEKKLPYELKRKCEMNELNYAEAGLVCHDIYIPIVGQNETVEAIMAFTRIGHEFSQQEIENFKNFSKQIAITLEKIYLYEQTEQQRKITQDILNNIHEGIIFVDSVGKIIQVNSKMYELAQFKKINQLQGADFTEWSKEFKHVTKNGEELITFMKLAIENKVEKRTIIYQIDESETKIIQIYFENLRHNHGIYGTIFVHRDITREYEVDKMKSEFVSTVSHELRTPLASVLGFTELMLNRDLKPDRMKKYLNMVYQEATRLTALINDFLDIQRMESGKQTYDKKYLDIVPIINDVIQLQTMSTQLHRIVVEQKTIHTFVLGDKDKIYQVFNNLIHNAIKYSPRGGTIRIEIDQIENSLSISVQDEGLGIPNEAISKLFSKFYRVDNSDRRKIGGTGLGLAIVKEIMIAHNGDVDVKSSFGEGSTFTVSFPQTKYLSQDKDKLFEQDSKGKVNVIIVEDDMNLSFLLKNELMDKGFNVISFSNGEKALEEIQTNLPDVIVLDIMLEGNIDGWNMIKMIKQKSDLSSIPIIISSALEEKQKGIELGVIDYLVKPYHPNKLTNIILQILLNKEKHGQILIPVKDEVDA